MPVSTAFKKAYSSLNKNQRLAVDSLDGPVIVLAGPGTGKTQVLTLRIANILNRTDTDPASILALTFTNAAAKEMRQRLISLIGKNGYYVQIATFHSFCADIIAENPERFARPRGLENITDLEKIDIVSKILENNSFLFLKPLNAPLLYLKDIIGNISDLKREGVTVKKFVKIVKSLTDDFEAEKISLGKTAFADREKLVGKNLDLLTIYKLYQEELEKRGRFDYEDMINWVVESFETDEELLLKYQEKYQYFLCDEYQDTNSAQNRLLFALSGYWGEKANVFVVGDEDQSIFGFQGASRENTAKFKKHFPHALEIVLDQNYRSTKTLLSSAAALISRSPLFPNANHQIKKIRVAQFESPLFEDEFLIRSIKKKIKEGIDPKDIAVIAKENKDLDHLAPLLKERGIPYRLEGGINILTSPLVSQFIKILNLVATLDKIDTNLDLFFVLNFPYFKLDPKDILKAAHSSSTNRRSLFTEIGTWPVHDLLVSWSHRSAFHTLPETFRFIFAESGLLDYILGLPEPFIELNRFSTLFEEVKKEAAAAPGLTLSGFVANLNLMADHGLKLIETDLVVPDNAVTLTTAHKSKGLEWQIVYIYRFADSHWSNKNLRQMIKLPSSIVDTIAKEDKNAEERRLFYVALTRAKQSLYLTGANTYLHSAKMVFPAMYLTDLPPEHLRRLDTKKIESKAQKILAALLSPAELVVHPGEADQLQKLIENYKLSPTALNTYLECRYKFKLDNLYRLPRAKAPAMAFGTAVHYALENLYRHFDKKKMLSDFEKALKKEILTDTEFKERLDHGLKILSAYFDHYQGELKKPLFTERKFGSSTSSPALLDDIPLTGKVDRIDLMDGKSTRLIDYKTGSPKPKEANYHRQLVFYHLLAGLDPSFPYSIKESVLDFIEPDKSGKFVRVTSPITPEEINSLKQLIKDSFKDIRALDFSRTSDTGLCARCEFKNHCWPNGLPQS